MTTWNTQNRNTASYSNETKNVASYGNQSKTLSGRLTKEDGFYLLLENGQRILLEQANYQSQWNNQQKS